MIGGCGVGDIRRAERRHVAGDTLVGLVLRQAYIDRQAAGSVLMAAQAALTIEGDALVGLRHAMRIVAGDAAQLAVAFAKTATVVHLLHGTDKFLVSRALGPDQHRPEELPGQSRAVVKVLTAARLDAQDALQVALLTNGLPQLGRQTDRVDDGVVKLLDRLVMRARLHV